MVRNISEVNLDETNIKLAIKTIYSPTNFNKKINSPKYLLIDWKGANLEKIKEKLENLDEDLLMEYFDNRDYINNTEVLTFLYKKFEYPNEEILWNELVDKRIISDSFYQKNSYDENLSILFKNMEFKLPLE